jgi:hypothetical protein
VDVQIVDMRGREQAFDDGFDLLPVDQSVIDHHPPGIERPHGKPALAELFGNFIHPVAGLIAFAHEDRKPHPIRRVDGMALVIDQ